MDTNHRNRKPTRLRGFDYTQRRSYFVTVCTQDRCEILADICRGGALLLPIGEIVEREIKALSEKYGNLVDRYVIMPNHIHLLLNLCAQTQGVSLCDIVCALKSRTTKLANEFNRSRADRFGSGPFMIILSGTNGIT